MVTQFGKIIKKLEKKIKGIKSEVNILPGAVSFQNFSQKSQICF